MTDAHTDVEKFSCSRRHSSATRGTQLKVSQTHVTFHFDRRVEDNKRLSLSDIWGLLKVTAKCHKSRACACHRKWQCGCVLISQSASQNELTCTAATPLFTRVPRQRQLLHCFSEENPVFIHHQNTLQLDISHIDNMYKQFCWNLLHANIQQAHSHTSKVSNLHIHTKLQLSEHLCFRMFFFLSGLNQLIIPQTFWRFLSFRLNRK